MTVTTYTDLVQGSDEWLEARRGLVTASTVGALITTKTLTPADNDTSRGLLLTLLAERITGIVEPVYVSDDMMRGTMDEPIARGVYATNYQDVTECGFMIRELADGVFLGYSPDGLVGDDGLIEVKSRKPKEQVRTILANEVPAANMAQIQAGLLVSGREWCDYVSYSGGLPMYVHHVWPDDAWQDAITAAVIAAEQRINAWQADYTRAVAGFPATERIDYLQAERIVF